MSDVIKLLPDSVANQIAAGEVIQRPASVVKELVENAIDAQATNIQIILKDAGRTLIQVIDNGVGMTDTDARLAFERHSTSKIRQADDLFSLHTLGFRGEALASIAAISQVELRTRKKESTLGTKLYINASTCEKQEPDMCPVGSNFMIKNLFFNVPARRKFLKSNQVELSNIVKEFEKLALVNHHVEFSLVHNDRPLYKLMASNFLQRIAAVMGHNIENQLIPVNVDTSLVNIHGFIAKPEHARKRNYLQFFFVNGRYMRHPYFHKAVMSSYDQLIPTDQQPNYFLIFDVDPETIDVNIHPTKTEIKFENEMHIWQILAAGVKASLGRFNEVPQIDFDTNDAPEIPPFSNHPSFTPPAISVDPTYNPFKQQHSGHSNTASNTDWEQLYKNFEKKKADSLDNDDNFLSSQTYPQATTQDEAQTSTLPLSVDDSPMYVQMKGHYIVSPVKSGLMIIDQHRAHINILYEQIVKQISAHSLTSQTILFPEVLALSHAQNVILCGLQDDLEKAGFSLAHLGGNDWSVTAIPSCIKDSDIRDVILQVIEAADTGGQPVKSRLMEHIALTVAKASAIPYGRRLQPEEMDRLTGELMRLSNPSYTPDGKVVFTIISHEHIAKMF